MGTSSRWTARPASVRGRRWLARSASSRHRAAAGRGSLNSWTIDQPLTETLLIIDFNEQDGATTLELVHSGWDGLSCICASATRRANPMSQRGPIRA